MRNVHVVKICKTMRSASKMGHKKTPKAGWRGCSVSLTIENMKLKSPTCKGISLEDPPKIHPPFAPPSNSTLLRSTNL